MPPVTRTSSRHSPSSSYTNDPAPINAPEPLDTPVNAVHQAQPLSEMKPREKCLHVLEELSKCHMKFSDFVHSVVYGDESCKDNTVMTSVRKQFLRSEHLPQLLVNMHRPPLAPKGGPRAQEVGKVMEKFAQDLMVDIFARELKGFSDKYAREDIDPTGIDSLADLTSKSMFEGVYVTKTHRS